MRGPNFQVFAIMNKRFHKLRLSAAKRAQGCARLKRWRLNVQREQGAISIVRWFGHAAMQDILAPQIRSAAARVWTALVKENRDIYHRSSKFVQMG